MCPDRLEQSSLRNAPRIFIFEGLSRKVVLSWLRIRIPLCSAVEILPADIHQERLCHATTTQ